MAVLAMPVGLIGFPYLPHWVLQSELRAISTGLGVAHDPFLQLVLYLWPGACLTFCVVSLLRVLWSNGQLRGGWMPVVGLTVQGAWIVVALVLDSLFSF